MKHIVLVLHGYDCKLSWYESIRTVIENSYPDPTVIIPPLKLSVFSTADPDTIVADAIKLVDAEWQQQTADGGMPPQVVIIGHSTGALLARKLCVVACGETERVSLEEVYGTRLTPRPWAEHVDRIILFAGMNRGWTLNPHLYTKTAFLMRIGYVLGSLMAALGVVPLAFKTRRGAPFITQLRIQWLAMLREAAKRKVGNVPVIQLLGTQDDIISPEDNVDMVTGGNFIYLEMPGCDHLSVLKMDDTTSGKKRTDVFRASLQASVAELTKIQVQPADPNFMRTDESVTDVVFVIHGIRDTGYWTQKVARRVKALGDKEGRVFATETSTYGYFAMLPFLLSFARRRKVEWLMDQYTENLALYPNASFSFMGHSNGTYLLARALKEYPACRFKHVVFAGSVVEARFDWQQQISTGRIEKFFNFVASSDWVVAMFPKTFQTLRIQDLGSGGFDGFNGVDVSCQLKFVRGSHGEATREEYWDEIAHFIVNGTPSEDIHKLACEDRSFFMKILGASAPIPFLLILSLLAYIGYRIWNSFDLLYASLFMVVYFLVIWRVVTRI